MSEAIRVEIGDRGFYLNGPVEVQALSVRTGSEAHSEACKWYQRAARELAIFKGERRSSIDWFASINRYEGLCELVAQLSLRVHGLIPCGEAEDVRRLVREAEESRKLGIYDAGE